MRKEIIDQRIKEKEHNHQKNEIISEVMERIASTNAAGTQITMSASANLQKTLEEPLMLTLLFLIALLGICHLLKSL